MHRAHAIALVFFLQFLFLNGAPVVELRSTVYPRSRIHGDVVKELSELEVSEPVFSDFEPLIDCETFLPLMDIDLDNFVFDKTLCRETVIKDSGQDRHGTYKHKHKGSSGSLKSDPIIIDEGSDAGVSSTDGSSFGAGSSGTASASGAEFPSSPLDTQPLGGPPPPPPSSGPDTLGSPPTNSPSDGTPSTGSPSSGTDANGPPPPGSGQLGVNPSAVGGIAGSTPQIPTGGASNGAPASPAASSPTLSDSASASSPTSPAGVATSSPSTDSGLSSSAAASSSSSTATDSSSPTTTSPSSPTATDSASASAATATSTGTPTSSAGSNGRPSSASAAQQTSASGTPFSLPGQKLQVLPIGLGVFAGISVIALIVVGLVTWERTKYRKAFRQRRLAEQGANSSGYGGMSERPM